MPLPILIAMPIPLADANHAEGVLQYAESKLSSLLIDVSGVVDADDGAIPEWLELASRLSPEVVQSGPDGRLVPWLTTAFGRRAEPS